MKKILKLAKDAQSSSNSLNYLNKEINELDERLVKIVNEMRELGNEINKLEEEKKEAKKRAKQDGWKLSTIPSSILENAYTFKWTKKKKRKKEIARQNLDKTVEEIKKLFKERPEEFVNINEL